MESLPDRPHPARPLGEAVRAWLQWFGLVRLIVIAIAVAAVGAGSFWLLRAPPTPIENTLPVASRSTSTAAPAGSATSSTAGGNPVAPSTTLAVPVASFVVVDVAGAVVAPGVYELPAIARVHEAIASAGGLAPDADVEAINLAAIVHDGDRLYVPRVGRPVPTVVAAVSGGSVGGGSTADSKPPAGPIDLNRATAAQLDALPGVGPATAAAIVAYREQNGPFGAIDDLLKVRGIGPAKLDAMRALIAI